jgi:hypothetical protein
MKLIRAEVLIHAPAVRVWDLLTDFAAYRRWNPSIRSVRGVAAAGERLTLFVALPLGGAMPVPVTVLAADAPHCLRWVGEAALPGFFRGEHSFRIVPDGPGCVRLIQEEQFTGWAVPLLGFWINGHTQRGFQASCRVLKLIAENGRLPQEE